jgi:hypothetical protein
MSFNSYTFNRNNQTIPYSDSNVEVGYYGGVGYVSNWYSMPVAFITNNGIASTFDGYGIIFANAGIYRLTLGLTPFTTGGANDPNTISFCFGTIALGGSSNNTNTLSTAGAGMQSYNNNNTAKPGLITWNVSSYSSGNSTSGTYVYDQNGLHYEFYSKAFGDGEQYPGILSSILTVTANAGQSIYFNIKCNNGLTMLNSYFTLEMISSVTF